MISRQKYLAAFAILLLAPAAHAQQDPSSQQQMQAARACAAKQGVTLPLSPGAHSASPAPQLTDKQKKIVDACFKASGLNTPARHEDPLDNGEGSLPGDRLGPPPEQNFD